MSVAMLRQFSLLTQMYYVCPVDDFFLSFFAKPLFSQHILNDNQILILQFQWIFVYF